MNLLIFVVPFFTFTYFTTVGYSILCCLYFRKNVLLNLLLAPTLGIVATLIPVFWLNRYGYPVKTFAIPLTILLLLGALITLLITRVRVPIKKYTPFVCIFLLALLLVGRPLLSFGFDWLSYANDDMANYCLGALHFLQRGYSDPPILENLIANKDLSQYYWFTFVPGMSRSACELLLAWLSTLTHLNPAHIFMSLNLAFYLTLVSASGALVMLNKNYRHIALITCLLVACSALTALGVLYELIGQVLGLSLLIVVTILFFHAIDINHYSTRISLLLSLTLSALLIAYPEVAPIAGLGFFLYVAISSFKGWKPSKSFYLILICCASFSIIILNKYWLNILVFLQYQATQGITDYKGALFPYFLIPSGIANLWGMQTLAVLSNEPWLSISIFLSFVLSLLLIFFLVKQVPRRFPAAIITTTFLMLSLYLAVKLKLNSGFSLFKIAMYIQPFFFAVLVVGLFNLRYKKLTFIIVISLILVNLYTQINYVNYSYGHVGTPFNELPNGSNTHLLSELDKLKLPQNALIMSDTPSIVGSKLLSLNFADNSLQFFSHTFFDNFLFSGSKFFKQLQMDASSRAETLINGVKTSEERLSFNLGQSKTNSFSKRSNETQKNQWVIMETSLRNIFNRRQLNNNHQNYVISPIEQVKNHLIFINSKLGQYYYLGESSNISLYNLEQDYFYPSESMCAIGRYLLFRIINPKKKIRLALTITTTLNHDGNNQLPKSKLIGDKHYTLPLIGRGSARIFSSTFEPQMIHNSHYIMLDMKDSSISYNPPRSGLMQLYGNNVFLDTRHITGYVRDISIIDDDEYNHLRTPTIIKNFPDDLRNQSLEYSGIYEDGWISENAFFVMQQPINNNYLTIKGSLSHLTSNTLYLYVDNKLLATEYLKEGSFTLRFKLTENSKHRIELRFAHVKLLSNADPRPAAAKLEFIGFT